MSANRALVGISILFFEIPAADWFLKLCPSNRAHIERILPSFLELRFQPVKKLRVILLVLRHYGWIKFLAESIWLGQRAVALPDAILGCRPWYRGAPNRSLRAPTGGRNDTMSIIVQNDGSVWHFTATMHLVSLLRFIGHCPRSYIDFHRNDGQ